MKKSSIVSQSLLLSSFFIHIIFAVNYQNIKNRFIARCNFDEYADFSFDAKRFPCFEPKKVKTPSVICIRGRDIPYFFKKYHPFIRHPYIIITHGEYRDAFKPEYQKYLEDQKVIAWFGVHAQGITHEKFNPIPLGIKVKHSEDDAQKNILSCCDDLRKKFKKNLIYLNFAQNNPERRRVKNLFLDDPHCLVSQRIAQKERLGFKDYLKEMGSCRFTFSPPGNAQDSYRTWESIAVGSIPIVLHSELDDLYKDLPIIIVDDWSEISLDFLEQKYQEFGKKKFKMEKLFMGYWLQKIEKIKTNYINRRRSNYGMEQSTPLIESVNVIGNKITVKPHASFRDPYLRKPEFFVEYDDQTLHLETLDHSIVTIPFILCAMPAIWYSGKKYSIESMDEDLFYSLKKINHVFKLFYPQFAWDGELIPERLKKNIPHALTSDDHVAVLFSGGLDSVCSSFAHFDKKQLLLTIHGCDVPLGKTNRWAIVKKQVAEFANTYGHDVSFLAFNFYGMLNRPYFSRAMGDWWAYTSGSLSHAGLVAPLLFYKGYRHLVFASSNTIECPRPFGNHPCIDNNLCFGSIQVMHDGGELSRPEKVQLINKVAEKNNLPLPILRVCRHDYNGSNCGHCFSKCLLTMNNILAVGLDYKDFGFDVPLATLKQMTKQKFSAKKPFLKCGGLWDWECNQKALRSTIIKNSIPADFNDYYQWFLSLDLEKFCKQNRELYEKKKPFYARLWSLAYHGTDKQLFAVRAKKSYQ